MIRQDFDAIPSTNTEVMEVEKGHVWEVRHAGLLGIKYEVAVRSDLFTGESIDGEHGDFDSYGKEVLSDVADAAILGYVLYS
jgi:TATA-binding protein-associated factor